ncbi:MAG: homocysteine S-methyltransferase family protein [Melioribacteraceae bacterium]|nr:homocysteine S-methyltransferase family protein [Melioribacteraceae bacterium]
MKLLERYHVYKRPLVLDGAIGSYLESIGLTQKDSLWSTRALIDDPDKLTGLYKRYIDAGADILTTNTFRTNPHSLELSGIKTDSFKLVKNACRLIKSLPGEFIVAGSNAPAEDCYQQKRTIPFNLLEENHYKHIEALADNGVDFILNETQSHWDEIELISKYCSTNNIPYVISLYFAEDLTILSGQNLYEVLSLVWNYNPVCISFNCIAKNIFDKLPLELVSRHLWGFYLNCFPNNVMPELTPVLYSELLNNTVLENLLFVGSCCGSGPEHTKKIKETILAEYSG